MNTADRQTPVRIVLLALALSGFFFAGCSGTPPEISRVIGRLIFVHDIQARSYSERLSVFVVGSDADGTEDLATLYVINDEAELFWSVDSKSWTSSTAEGEGWIGANGLSMPGGALFPAGEYRVILQDAGGDTAEDSFTLQGAGVNPAKTAYPSVSVKSGVIKVSGGYLDQELWIFSKEDKFLMRLSAGGATSVGTPAAAAVPGGPPAGSALPVGSGSAAGVPTSTAGPSGAQAGGGTGASSVPVGAGSSGPSPSPPAPLTLQGIQAAYPGLAQGFIFWIYSYNAGGGYGLLSGPFSSNSLQPQ